MWKAMSEVLASVVWTVMCAAGIGEIIVLVGGYLQPSLSWALFCGIPLLLLTLIPILIIVATWILGIGFIYNDFSFKHSK